MSNPLIAPLPGDVLLWRGGEALDLLVRIGTASDYDHIGIVQPGNLTLEALPGGVQANPITARYPFFLVSRNKNDWNGAATALAKVSVGVTEYSYLNDIAAAFGAQPFTDKEVQCAQLVKHVLQLLGEPIPADLPITPDAVCFWLQQQGYVMQYQASSPPSPAAVA